MQTHLAKSRLSEVAMTFSEIESVLGAPLPNSANQYRAWWSNNAFNNVMTKAWRAAGFRTEQVDMEQRCVVFRRTEAATSAYATSEAQDTSAKAASPLFGRLKGTVRIAIDVDLTAPADQAWGVAS